MPLLARLSSTKRRAQPPFVHCGSATSVMLHCTVDQRCRTKVDDNHLRGRLSSCCGSIICRVYSLSFLQSWLDVESGKAGSCPLLTVSSYASLALRHLKRDSFRPTCFALCCTGSIYVRGGRMTPRPDNGFLGNRSEKRVLECLMAFLFHLQQPLRRLTQ